MDAGWGMCQHYVRYEMLYTLLELFRMTVVWIQNSRVAKKFRHRYPFYFSALLSSIYQLRKLRCIIRRKPTLALMSELFGQCLPTHTRYWALSLPCVRLTAALRFMLCNLCGSS